MSNPVSRFFRSGATRQAIRSIVQYLDTRTDLTNDQKKDLAMKAVKLLHGTFGFTNVFDPLLESAIDHAIEFSVGEIHEWAQQSLSQLSPGGFPQAPVTASIYAQWNKGPLPDESVLLKLGFKSGDVTYHSEDGWIVFEPGATVVVSKDLEPSAKAIGS